METTLYIYTHCITQKGGRTTAPRARNHSTNMALMTIIDRISEAQQNKEFVLWVFLDLSKAFDTGDHEILCQKLQCYGIRGLANDWIKSHLSNRSHYVYYINTSSTKLTITCGVPKFPYRGHCCFYYISIILLMSQIFFSPYYLLMTLVYLYMMINLMI